MASFQVRRSAALQTITWLSVFTTTWMNLSSSLGMVNPKSFLWFLRCSLKIKCDYVDVFFSPLWNSWDLPKQVCHAMTGIFCFIRFVLDGASTIKEWNCGGLPGKRNRGWFGNLTLGVSLLFVEKWRVLYISPKWESIFDFYLQGFSFYFGGGLVGS